MTLFASPKEKALWFSALVVAITIFSTLFVGQPFERLLRDQNTQVVLFLSGMVLGELSFKPFPEQESSFGTFKIIII